MGVRLGAGNVEMLRRRRRVGEDVEARVFALCQEDFKTSLMS